MLVVGLRLVVPLFIPRFPLPAHPRRARDRRRRQVDLRRVHRPAARQLPVVRQGARHLLPDDRVPVGAAELAQPVRGRGRGVPLVLPAGRGARCSSSPTALAAHGVPEHVRVLRDRDRGGPHAVGRRPPEQGRVPVDGRAHLGGDQAAAGVVDPRRAAGLHRRVQRSSVDDAPVGLGRAGGPRGGAGRRRRAASWSGACRPADWPFTVDADVVAARVGWVPRGPVAWSRRRASGTSPRRSRWPGWSRLSCSSRTR